MRRRILTKRSKQQRRRRKEPLEVWLTLQMNMGDVPGDAITLIDDRRVPLVGSVFDNRDRIAREFLRLLAVTGLRQPGVWRSVLSRGLHRGR